MNAEKDALNTTTTITTNSTNNSKQEKHVKPSQIEALPVIIQPSQPLPQSQPQSQQDLINKKLRRKPKTRKQIPGQSDDELSYKNVTPSGVKPVLNDDSNKQQININTVNLPKIGAQEAHAIVKPAKEKDSEKDKHKEKQDSLALRKLKRQISNSKHVNERYEILKILGDGNFAVVKQAKLRSTDNEYAIKIIDKSKMKV